MKVKVSHRWLGRREVAAHKDDPQFKIKEPGLIIHVHVALGNKPRTELVFITEKQLRAHMGGWLRRLLGL